MGRTAAALLTRRLQTVATRIRRSLKPKRVMAVTEELAPVVEDILRWIWAARWLLDHGKPFGWRAVPERVWPNGCEKRSPFPQVDELVDRLGLSAVRP